MKQLVLAIMLLVLLALPAPAYADIAPPAQPPGVNPEPGYEATQVRMLGETVLLDVGPGLTTDSLGRAHVAADFTMLNLGEQAESMAVRFPISANDGWFNYPEIKDVQVKVNGKTVPTRRIQGPDPRYGDDLVPWIEFDATFPPGEDVDIRVAYWLEGSGEYPFVSFQYVLSTGAGWKDTIGSADLVVRLPYEANIQNVILDYPIGWSQTSPGARLQGDEIRWHYQDFEPSLEQDLHVALVMPSAWQKVLEEQAAVARNPKDGEAWGRLGKLYKEMAFLRREVRGDPGGPTLYERSVEAYEKCLDLLPNDALWHVGLAELHYMHYYMTSWGNPAANGELVQALDLLREALEINPNTARAVELLQDISFSFPEYLQMEGDQFIFFYLTATPLPPTAYSTDTPVASATPRITSIPSLSLQPSASPSPLPSATLPAAPSATAVAVAALATPQPAASGSSGGLCAPASLLPLLILVPLKFRGRVMGKRG